MNIIQSLQKIAKKHKKVYSFLKIISKPFIKTTSSRYVKLNPNDVAASTEQLKDAWMAKNIPAKQRQGVDKELLAYRSGVRSKGVDALVDILRNLLQSKSIDTKSLTLLEIGCSSGYYSEVFEIKKLPIIYSGCDFSESFIAMAKQYYPSLSFQVEDATSLGYSDACFEVVVSGCCLLHIHHYEDAIREAARVSCNYVVFHRTPILHKNKTTYFTKLAYGVKTIEIHFNEQELVSLFSKYGLYIVDIVTIDAEWRQNDSYATKTYLCKKILNKASN